MLFDSHNHAFEVFGGVHRRGIYDNMRTEVDGVRPGKQHEINLLEESQANASRYDTLRRISHAA
ncbi:MAG: hypothetical protein H7Z18_11715 [Methylophilaceae bacterium]|nr:hypothetical protein [Methylophilaceae bacterium]